MITSTPNYAKAQHEAYQILKTNKVSIFPIEPLKIIEGLNNCQVMSYQEFGKQHSLSLEEVCTYLNSDDAATWGKDEKKITFYNDCVTSQRRKRFTLAHELGHIVLGHIDDNKISTGVSDEQYDFYEKEANYFAKRLLAPLPIIYRLVDEVKDHRISAFDISSIFQISDQTAFYVVNNMNNMLFEDVDEEMCSHYQEGLDNALKIIDSNHLIRA